MASAKKAAKKPAAKKKTASKASKKPIKLGGVPTKGF